MEQKSRSLARKGIRRHVRPRRDIANSISTSRRIRKPGIWFTSAAWRSGRLARRRISASFSAIAITTCSRATTTASWRITDRACFTCASLWRTRSSCGLKRFDFTIGDEPYKLEWSDTDLKLYDYSATATWRGLPARGSSTVRRRIKRFIKQTPGLAAVSTARSAIGSLSQSASGSAACPAADRRPHPPRHRRSPASWATWICCGRWRWPAFPAPWCRGRAFPRSIRATRNRAWHGMIIQKTSTVSSTRSSASAKRSPNVPSCSTKKTAQLLLVSRFRERLARAFRFVVADAHAGRRPARQGALSGVGGAPSACRCRRRAVSIPPPLEPADLGLRFPLDHQAADPA